MESGKRKNEVERRLLTSKRNLEVLTVLLRSAKESIARDELTLANFDIKLYTIYSAITGQFGCSLYSVSCILDIMFYSTASVYTVLYRFSS